MVIVRNDFPQFEKEASEIAKEYYFINISIVKEPKDGAIYNNYGEIHIPDTNDGVFFAGALTHEVGHSFFDPVTLYNYLKALSKVKDMFRLSDEDVLKLGNVITDIITDYGISKNVKLRAYRRQYLKKMFNEWFDNSNPLKVLLWSFYNKIHGCGLSIRKPKFAKYVNKIVKILEGVSDREARYVELANILLDLLKQEGVDILGDLPTDFPLRADKEELEGTIKQIFKEARDIDEAENMIRLLAHGFDEAKEYARNSLLMLKAFYQEKANQVRSFIEYPKTIEHKGVKIGSRKWLMSDGLINIDVERTILKSGVNIPLVTSKTSRILDKFILSRESHKPIDIVISIDVSGSTGNPNGRMSSVSDYEIVMLYALIDEAKRLNHRVGLTLWSSQIAYTSLPRTYDYREVEKLKEKPLVGYWSGGGTDISRALRQAERYSDKLFLVFTDGQVFYGDLIDVDNVVFFLIMPSEGDYKMFVEKYGSHRVVRIDNVENIPKVTLSWYRKVFC